MNAMNFIKADNFSIQKVCRNEDRHFVKSTKVQVRTNAYERNHWLM